MSESPLLQIGGPGAAAPLGPVLGIDLGTTNTLAAVWRDGAPQVLRNRDGAALIPSVVSFPEDGPPVVGRAALERSRVDPERTIHSVKRLIGKSVRDLGRELATLPYRIVDAEDRPRALIELGDRRISPEEVSGLILAEARRVASEALGLPEESLRRAVITVPAYFDDAQRQATRQAAVLAGLEVLRIVNEPTAAALAYGLDQEEASRVLVYDLGGGTFDASLLQLDHGMFRVLATAGDTYLGGDDFDRTLVLHFAGLLRERTGRDLLEDAAARSALRMAAEACKKELSRHEEAEFVFRAPDLGVVLRETVRRSWFEQQILPLVERTLARCAQVLRDSGLDVQDVDEVVLVGGSTRVPLVRWEVQRFFGREPHTELDPDQVVALGAAIQGAVLAGQVGDVLLLDVTPLSLGLETMGGAVARLIPRNSPIPARATETFTTFVDGQTAVRFHVVQGEREMATDCRSLGEFVLRGIPPMAAGLPRIQVEFTLDANGILRVRAKEEGSGSEAAIEVQPKHGLTDEEVEAMLRDAWEHAEEDLRKRRTQDLRTELGVVLRATKKNLDEARRSLAPASLERLLAAVDEAEAALAEGGPEDPNLLQGILDELEQASQPLAEHLMNRVAEEAVRNRRLDELAGEKTSAPAEKQER